MSTAHNHRRKLIARCKRQSPQHWHDVFRKQVDADVKKREGALVGSLQDVADAGLLPRL